MTWKKLIIVLLILAGLVAVPYYLYQSGQLLQWQDQILTELENTLEAEINVSDFSLLPLNQIRLKEVEIEREEDLDFYLAEVHLYYDLRNLLEIFWRDRLETDLAEALLVNLHQIWISEPELEIWNPEGEIFAAAEEEAEITLPDSALLWQKLPPLPAGAGLVIQGGNISYQEREGSLFLELERLEVKAQGEASLSAGIRGDLRLDGLELPGGNGILSRFDLAGLEAGLNLEQDSWELKADVMVPDLSQLEDAGGGLAREYGIDDLSLTGRQQLQLTALGRRDELDDFQVSGITELEEISFSWQGNTEPVLLEEAGLSREEAFEPIVLKDVSWQTDYRLIGGRLVISDLTFSFLDNFFTGEGNLQLTDPKGFSGINTGEDTSSTEEGEKESYFLADYYFELSGSGLDLAELKEYFQLEIPAEIEEEIAPWSLGLADFTLAVTPDTGTGIGESGNDFDRGEEGAGLDGGEAGSGSEEDSFGSGSSYYGNGFNSGEDSISSGRSEDSTEDLGSGEQETGLDGGEDSTGEADAGTAGGGGESGLSGPVLLLEMELANSRIKDQSLGASLQGRWQQERFWLDELEVREAGERGLVRFRGDYQPGEAGYNFQLELEKLEAGLLLELLPERLNESLAIPEFQGILQASLTGSGQGFSAADPDISGEVRLTDFYYQDQDEFFGPEQEEFSASEIRADFWLAEGLLEVGPARAETELAGLELGGYLDLVQREMDLRLETEELDLQEMALLAGIEENVTGRASLAGRLTGTFASPGISAALEIPEAELFGVDVREGYGNLYYFADRDLVSIRGLDFISRETSVRGRGDFYLTGEEPEIEARLEIAELTYAYINEIFDIALPLEGDVSGNVEVFGTPGDLEVVSQATSRSTSLQMGEQVFTFTNASSSFYWETGEPFQVRNLVMEKEEAVFTMDGDFAEEFQADFSFKDYPLEKLDFEELEGLSGLASARGQAAGSYDNLGGEGEIEIQELSWQGEDLGSLSGFLSYQDERLTIAEADWQPGPGEYRLSGSISSLLTEPLLDIRLEMAEVELDYYLERFEVESPLELNYLFGGVLNLRGSPAEPEAEIDLTAEGITGEMGRIELAGRVGQEYDISLAGENVELDWLSALFEEEIDFSGELEFAGSLSGPLREPDFELTTLASNIGIGPYQIKEVSGRASLSGGEILTLDQELIAEPGRELNLTARLPWQEPAEAELELRARDFPLDPLAGFYPGLQELTGSIDGQIQLSGASLEEIDTAGELKVMVDKIDLGQEETLDLDGSLVFSGARVSFEDFLARIDGEELELKGGLNLSDFDNFWDLRTAVSDLSLVFQRSSADLTGNLSLTGPLFSPLMGGEITLDNLIAVMPEEIDFQEIAAAEPELEEERSFNPRVDVQVAVGSNNYFQHENAEVLIQRGELKLLYGDDFEIEGQLSSSQGSVYFYNNRFSLESARLDFDRGRGFIPRVAARARTTVDGNEITVNLDGPADNMRTTFASTPPLEEEEIISQLIGRGGLGGVLAGQQLSMPQVVQQELMRIVRERLEIDFLANVSAQIRQALELDRFELVSEGGLLTDQEMTLYMGKELGDRLYLESESRFGFDERDTSVSFRYFFTERTFLEGTFDSLDDFSISIETEIEF